MGNYVTVASVRRTVGIATDEINDTNVEATITECEPQVERYLNTSFVPVERIDILNGNGTLRIYTMKNPLLSVRELKIDGTAVDVDDLAISKGSGRMELLDTASISVFKEKTNSVVVKYLHGSLVESSTSTTLSTATIAGTNVSMTVGSITGLADNDWLEIYGMDGYREVFQINGTPA
jgi:hypothetical protein